jgi:hypothetical protein
LENIIKGFKKGVSTHSNIVKMINWISNDAKKKKIRSSFVLADNKKAYYSANRILLLDIVDKRAQSEEGKHIDRLIRILI